MGGPSPLWAVVGAVDFFAFQHCLQDARLCLSLSHGPLHPHLCSCTHAGKRAHMHVRMLTHMYTSSHTFKHTYLHLHTHTCKYTINPPAHLRPTHTHSHVPLTHVCSHTHLCTRWFRAHFLKVCRRLLGGGRPLGGSAVSECGCLTCWPCAPHSRLPLPTVTPLTPSIKQSLSPNLIPLEARPSSGLDDLELGMCGIFCHLVPGVPAHEALSAPPAPEYSVLVAPDLLLSPAHLALAWLSQPQSCPDDLCQPGLGCGHYGFMGGCQGRGWGGSQTPFGPQPHPCSHFSRRQ